MKTPWRLVPLAVAGLAASMPAFAQGRVDDYRRAERFLTRNVARAGALLLDRASAFAGSVPAGAALAQAAQSRPNIVLMFPDNLGWGEVGVYGGVRGVPTPNIDRLAAEGMRLNNFNVEVGCIGSRMALLTARYAARAGTSLTPWEVTIAEGLRSKGYATGAFGKWHVAGGNWEGEDTYHPTRDPQFQGFDEWYGIGGTSHVAQFGQFHETWDSTATGMPAVWEGKAGERSRRVKPYDMESRRTTDREAAERGIAFMTRAVRARKPFFLYYPITQIHFPSVPHPDFAGKTGAGDIGDAMADVDHNVGLVLAAIDRLGIARNTLVLWCTDGGAEGRRPWRGDAGPWSGFYAFSVKEGGIRTPCLVRWPGRIPAGRVSNEMMHEVDLFPTFAAAIGAPDIVPSDRAIDGVDQLAFLEGRQNHANRESVLFVSATGQQIQAIKWRSWKLWYQFPLDPGDPSADRVRLFHLRADPKEDTDVKDFNPWVLGVMDSIAAEYDESIRRFPPVPLRAPDSYAPPPTPVAASSTRRLVPRLGSPAAGSPAPTGTIGSTTRHRPDFSGYWTAQAGTAVAGQGGSQATAGSGWGPSFTVIHRGDSLLVQRQFYVSADVQPPLMFRYALSGREARNPVLMGRGTQEQISTARWDADTLVITTRHVDASGDNGRSVTSEVRHRLSLRPGMFEAHAPLLVIETTRLGILGGVSFTTRTVHVGGGPTAR